MKRVFSITTFAVVAVAVAIWIQAARARYQADELLGALEGKRETLLRAVKQAESRSAAVAFAPAPVTKSPVPATTAALPRPAIPAVAPAKRSLGGRMEAEPQAQRLWLQRARAKAGVTYAEFFHRRNLSPAQIERFLENKILSDELDLDLGIAVAPGDAAGKSAASTLRQRGKADYEAAQRTTLGNQNYEALLEYERTAWLRNVVVNTLAGGGALAGLPLTAEQGDRLLKAALAAAGNDSSASGEQLVRQMDWEMLDAQAQQILTADQFAFFRRTDPPGEYASRWKYQIDAAVARAQQAEAEKSRPKPAN